MACPTSNYSLWISVLFPWYAFLTVKYVSVRGFSVAVSEIFSHGHTFTTFSLHQNVPVNKRHKFGREYNIPRRVDIVLGLICSILENIKKYLNYCNKINKCICMKYVSTRVIKYQHVSITFVITIRVALKE